MNARATLSGAATLFAAVANPTSPYVRTPYVGTISVNAEDGAVMSEDNADGKAYPDSLPDIGCYECDIPKPGFLLQVR